MADILELVEIIDDFKRLPEEIQHQLIDIAADMLQKEEQRRLQEEDD